MPSPLTRRVFRQLLSNKPILHRGCLRRNTLLRTSYATIPQDELISGCAQQRRTFFDLNMFRAKTREKKDVELDPGIEQMMGLVRRQNMRARLPPPEDVASALEAFFKAKKNEKVSLTDTQAQLVLRSLQYYLESKPSEPPPYIYHASYVLSRGQGVRSDAHVELARIIFETSLAWSQGKIGDALEAYCKVLCHAEQPDKARELLLLYPVRVTGSTRSAPAASTSEAPVAEQDEAQDKNGHSQPFIHAAAAGRIWKYILYAYKRANKKAEFLEALQKISEPGQPKVPDLELITLDFRVAHGNVSEIKKCWDEYWRHMTTRFDISDTAERHGASINAILNWCAANNQLDFGHAIVRDVLKIDPPKPFWDAIFVWAASIRKGPDEIFRMIDVMEQSNGSLPNKGQQRKADIVTINALVELAISKEDPYLAERFVSLGRDRKIFPDSRTFVLQMNYRLDVNDVDGALVAYKNLQGQDISISDDVPTVNRLIVALCTSQRHDFDTIMNVAADLSDRRARFEPLTVSTLSVLHLSRDELHDVVDLLNTHAPHYSLAERVSVRDTLVAYCVDPSTAVTMSWETYSILRDVFDEMPRESRTELMRNFFRHGRSDMAVHVFNHMRNHSRPDTIPIDETYISAFAGAAQQRDLESLEVLHNQLKLDYNINVTTHMRNALMVAYTACGQARDALVFWDEMCASHEGPSYESIHSALRACERSNRGDIKAQKIWTILRGKRIDLDRDLWASYAGALVGNGDIGLATRTLEEAETKHETEVDAFIAGSLFMAAPGRSKQDEVEQWIKGRFPGLWEELEKIGIQELENGFRRLAIDRTVTP